MYVTKTTTLKVLLFITKSSKSWYEIANIKWNGLKECNKKKPFN